MEGNGNLVKTPARALPGGSPRGSTQPPLPPCPLRPLKADSPSPGGNAGMGAGLACLSVTGRQVCRSGHSATAASSCLEVLVPKAHWLLGLVLHVSPL